MSTPEKSLQRWFTNNCPGNWHVQSLESSTAHGIPDLVVTLPRGVFWLELKAHAGKQARIRPMQWAWAQKNIAAGGHCFLLHRPPGPDWAIYNLADVVVDGKGDDLLITTMPNRRGEYFNELKEYLISQLHGPAT